LDYKKYQILKKERLPKMAASFSLLEFLNSLGLFLISIHSTNPVLLGLLFGLSFVPCEKNKDSIRKKCFWPWSYGRKED